MELRNSAGDPSSTGLGPYKATKLWNDVIAAFRQGVPRGRNRRYMRSVDNCFVGSSAVDWLLEYLKRQREFGSDVTRQQTRQLLNKFYKAGIFEEIQVSRRGRNKSDFSDSNRLYRLLPTSPSKGTRTPLSVRASVNVPQPLTTTHKADKPEKREKPRPVQEKSVSEQSREKQVEATQDLDVGRLPQCHLVGRFLTGLEINEVWKTAALSRLKKVLGVGGLEDVLQDYPVDGGHVRHNCIFLNKSGIVTNIQPDDQLPHWVLSAMKCLARWPEKVEGDLPSYPGFEKDVFGVVRDHFLGLPEPLITYDLYDVIINAFVQACNQLPRHSSPFSHAARDRSGLCQSLWSDSSLENIILNLTRKYCMADSRSDLYSLGDSRPNLYATSDGLSTYYDSDHSGLYSAANSYRDLTASHKDLAASRKSLAPSHKSLATSQRDVPAGGQNLANSRRNLATSYNSLATSQRDVPAGGQNLANSRRNLATSYSSLAPSRKNLAHSQRDLAGGGQHTASRDVYRAAHSHGDLQRTRQSYASTLPHPHPHHSKSHTDLPGQCRRNLAGSYGDLRGGDDNFGNLHGGRSVGNLPDAASSQHLPALSKSHSALSSSHSALGHLSESSRFKDSKEFRSNPDLQVSRYETAFGPENQTVTRVYYHNGMATDFHHNSAQEDDLSPVETHFAVTTDPQRNRSSHISFERANKSASLANGSESYGSAVGRSRSFNSLQQQDPDPHSSSAVGSMERGPEREDTSPSSPVRVRERRPPPYRRRRGERYNTVAGSQFALGQSRGLDQAGRELSSSTPYLPGVRLDGEGEGSEGRKAGTLERRPVHSGGRSSAVPVSASVSSGRAASRCSSLYMNLPRSGLEEERATKALQMVCLFLPPASRRKLHFLLKLMSKMVANPFLTFDPSQSTRSLVLGTFQSAVLRSREDCELDAVLVFQLVSFLVDHHMDIMAVPADMKHAVEDKLRSLEKPQIVYSPRDPSMLRFSQPISVQQYEASKANHSHNALLGLLDSIVRDQNMADREKRRRLKQFQKTYPDLYQRRFPDASSDPLRAEPRLRTKPPIFAKPLLKLRGLRV